MFAALKTGNRDGHFDTKCNIHDDYLNTLTLSAKAGFHSGRVKHLGIVSICKYKVRNHNRK
jgi:hypothetical protein